jgi:SAM-dependent methyltransferase
VSVYSNNFKMADVERFWDNLAEHEYEHANEKMNRVHTQRFREAVKRLPVTGESRVLNIWSKVGDGVPFLREAFGAFELVNAELSLEMLKASAALNPGELHVQTSLHEFPFRNSSFDAVLSLETLEHVPDPLLFLTEIERVLVPGGTLVMSLPPSAAEWTSIVNGILKFHHGEGPHRFLAPSEVKKMLADARLKLAEYDGTLFLPFGGQLIEKLDNALGRLLGKGPLGQLGIRQFYVCKATR